MNHKTAFVFPGQGSQSVGMGFDFAEKYSEFKDILQDHLNRADQALGYSLSQIIQKGPAEELKLTHHTQPALLLVSTAMARFLESKGIRGEIALGHSLGEYSALVYAGSIAFEDAIRLVHLRGKYMSEAVAPGVGGMVALVGGESSDVTKISQMISENGLLLEASVFNSPGQIVLSGHVAAIDLLEKKVADFPSVAKLARLEVSGPFHCELLKSAGENLRKEFSKISVHSPKTPVIFNVTAKPESDPAKIVDLLVSQVSKPVLWAQSVESAKSLGVEEIYEVGNGKVLAGLIRRIDRSLKVTTMEALSFSE